MSAIAAAIALQAVGGVLNYMGQREADEATKEAALINEAYYDAQADMIDLETERTADIFQRESEAVIGAQVSTISKSGVQFMGSSLSAIVSTKQSQQEERGAIRFAGEHRANLARLRARSANATVEAIDDMGPLRLASAIFSTGASIAQVSALSSTRASTTGLDPQASGKGFDANTAATAPIAPSKRVGAPLKVNTARNVAGSDTLSNFNFLVDNGTLDRQRGLLG